MGGHAVGELASKMAVDNIPHIYSKHAPEGAVAALHRAFVEANSSIYTRGKQNKEFERMGTTGTALVLRPEGAWVGHVGDSRAYRIRGGVIEQLSFDHSLLWELARRQRKSPEELIGIQSNVIIRSLGPEGSVEVDVEGPHPLERGDIYVLCSDGLSGQVTDRVIGAIASALPPREAVEFLVHLANLQGGPDNTTVIIVRVGGEPPAKMSDSQADVVFPISESGERVVPRFALMMYHLGKLPWGFILLILGILLGIPAIVLSYYAMMGAIVAFVLCGLTLLAGIVTLMVQNIRETRHLAERPEERSLQVYRQTPCPIDAAIYERLVQSAKTLEDSIKEKNWEYDARGLHARLDQASLQFKQQHLVEAFREQCRAMLILMDTVHRYRAKNEDFKPLW
jgi:protein phosphatase